MVNDLTLSLDPRAERMLEMLTSVKQRDTNKQVALSKRGTGTSVAFLFLGLTSLGIGVTVTRTCLYGMRNSNTLFYLCHTLYNPGAKYIAVYRGP